MSTELEDRIRATLDRRANVVSVDVPPERQVLARRRARVDRRAAAVALAAALVVCAGVGVVVARAGEELSVTAGGPITSTRPSGPEAPGPLRDALGPAARIGVPEGWELEHFTYVARNDDLSAQAAVHGPGFDPSLIDPGPYVEYRFELPDGQSLQVGLYTAGMRPPTMTSPEPPVVDVRGTRGHFLEYGRGRYRINWDEGGRTWEADGEPFADLDELVDALSRLVTLDDAAWVATMPTGLAEAVLSTPSGQGLTWSPETGASTFGTAPVGPSPTDAPLMW